MGQSNQPQARFYTCAALYKHFIYVYGGTHDHTDKLNDFWRVKISKSINFLVLFND